MRPPPSPRPWPRPATVACSPLAWAPVAARSWEGGKAIPKAILFALTGICLFCGILFTFNASAPSPSPPAALRRCAAATAEAERASNANRKPWLPLAFGLLFQPMYHTLIKDNLFGDVHIKNYMKSMALVTTIVAVVSAIVWLSYSQHHNFWCAKSLLLTSASSTSERVVRGAWLAGGARSRGWSTSSA